LFDKDDNGATIKKSKSGKAMTEDKIFLEDVRLNVLIPILNGIEARGRGELSAIADRLEKDFGMKNARVRLAELRSGARVLTIFYCFLLVRGGIMTISQILRGRNLDELTDVERDIVLRLGADTEELRLISEAKAAGLDVKKLLREHLKKS
jgi:hypothetical protein